MPERMGMGRVAWEVGFGGSLRSFNVIHLMFGIPWDEAKPAMARRRNKVAEIEDSDLPELSAADFARARPVADAMPGLIDAAKRARGRPRLKAPKRQISIRLAADVLAAYKAMGPGWQREVNAVLARALERKRSAKPKRKPGTKRRRAKQARPRRRA